MSHAFVSHSQWTVESEWPVKTRKHITNDAQLTEHCDKCRLSICVLGLTAKLRAMWQNEYFGIIFHKPYYKLTEKFNYVVGQLER
jgi:hypothetical protein